MKLDPILSLALTMHSAKGVYALLLGSGVSKAASIPTGWDVVLDLIRRVAKVAGEDCGSNPDTWFKKKYGAEPDYSILLNRLAPTPEQRQQILRGYFEPTDEEREDGAKQSTKAHKAIARLIVKGYVKVIITTNFDRLIERAIEEAGITPVVVSTPEALSGCLPLVHQRCIIIKLHGDYLDTRIKNTPKELAKYEKSVCNALDRIFDEFGLIVSGWSGEYDAALCDAIKRCKSRRFGFFWTSIKEATDLTQRLTALKGGSILRVTDADSFFEELADKVDVLDEVNSEHPLNVEAAVAMVKRYAAKPEQRIRLHDLLMREATLAFNESLVLEQTWRNDSKNQHRQFLMNVAQSLSKLRRMIGYAAYWCGDEIASTILSCIAKLAHEPLPPRHSGNLRDTWFRMFLGGNILYAAGVGMITAGKFPSAAKLLTLAHSDDHSKREQFVVSFTRNWSRVAEILNHGLNQAKFVPFSELMIESLSVELAELSPSQSAFETAFDEWELLIAMIYGELINERLEDGKNTWVTPGRYVYLLRYGHRSGLFPRANDPDGVDVCKSQQPFIDLIAAGFFGGKWERIVELRAIAYRVSRSQAWF